MLTKITLESALELSQAIVTHQQKNVIPEEGTLLKELVEAGEPIETTEPSDLEEAKESLSESTFTPVINDVNDHDAIQERVVEKVAKAMNRRILLTRNVINPLIKEYAQLITDGLSDMVPGETVVQRVVLPEFYSHPLASNLFGNHVDQNEPVPGIKTTKPLVENIESLKAGNEIIDAELDRIRTEHGDEELLQVVNDVFGNGETVQLLRAEGNDDYVKAVDRNFIIYLASRYLFDAPVQVRLDPRELQIALARISNLTATNAKNFMAFKNDIENKGTVTNDISSEAAVVNVFADNYDKFIAKGGNNAMLVGYVKRERGTMSLEEIIEHGSELEKRYDSSMNAKLRDLKLQQSDKLRKVALVNLPAITDKIPLEVLLTIKELSEPVIVDGKPVTNIRGKLIDRGAEYIREAIIGDLNDVYGFAFNIILNGLLPELGLTAFFATMEKYLEPSAGVTITPAQAAYYACLEEVVSFFVNQCKVKITTN